MIDVLQHILEPNNAALFLLSRKPCMQHAAASCHRFRSIYRLHVRKTGIAGLVGIRAQGVSDQYCSQRLLLKGLRDLKVTLFGGAAMELRRLIKICAVCFSASQ